jgi:hypothetical protein
MKLHRLEKIYATVLLVIFGGIVLHAPLSVGLGVLFPSDSLLIKSWKELLMALLIPIAIWMVTRHKLWPELARDWLFRLIVAYTALHCVMILVLYKGLQATMAGLAIDLRYILFFSLVYVLLRVHPACRKKMLLIGTIGAAVVVGFGVLQLFLPADILKYIGYSTKTIVPYLTVDQNHNFIRINSTLRGPNPVGAYALTVVALLASFGLMHKKWFVTRTKRWLFSCAAAASLVVLWVSYSRSAYIGAAVALAVALVVTMRRYISAKVWIISCAVVFGLAGGLFAARGTAFVSNTLLHENPHGGSSISSNAGHATSLETSFSHLLRTPLGSGVGSTGSASLYSDSATIIENQYLFIGHEIGWLGVALFTTLFVLIMIRLWRARQDWLALGVFASGIGLAIVGLLLPVWVDDTVSIVWWGLAAIALATSKRSKL